MNIIVVGCSAVGAELAYRLFRRGHRVIVVDEEESSFDNLPADFRGRTVEGEILAQDVLRRAGIEEADGLAAVTNSDTLNAVVGHVARTAYGVSNVVVRNYDPRKRSLYEAFELQVIGAASWAARRVEELLGNPSMRIVFSAGDGEVGVYEFTVPAAWNGRSLNDVPLAERSQVVALTRAGRAMLPTRETLLEAGDLLYVSATPEGGAALRERLQSAGAEV
jgi:trk system potassium uptake protein TrkA